LNENEIKISDENKSNIDQAEKNERNHLLDNLMININQELNKVNEVLNQIKH